MGSNRKLIEERERLFKEKRRRIEDGEPTKNPGDGLLLAPIREPREVYRMKKKFGLNQQIKKKLYQKYI